MSGLLHFISHQLVLHAGFSQKHGKISAALTLKMKPNQQRTPRPSSAYNF
jgi:hypothetical protein